MYVYEIHLSLLLIPSSKITWNKDYAKKQQNKQNSEQWNKHHKRAVDNNVLNEALAYYGFSGNSRSEKKALWSHSSTT